MPTFIPVHASSSCRLSLSFGDEPRDASRLDADVLELMVNRCATNALVQAAGCSSVSKLDELLWSKLVETSPHYLDREPTRYFTRLASGSPRLRSRGPIGRPTKSLFAYLKHLDDAAQEFWIAARWSFWELIHPDPINMADLQLIRTHMPGAGDVLEWHRLIAISSPEEQAKELLDAVKSTHPAVGVSALWQTLRQAGVDGDLRRYAYLYDAWLRCRPVLEESMLFRKMVDTLYDFTSVWFGQVEIPMEPMTSPITDRAEYFHIVRGALGELRQISDSRREAKNLWMPFRFNRSAQHEGLIVRPRSDMHAFFKGNVGPLRMCNWDMRWLQLKSKPLPSPPARSKFDNGATVTDTE